ncbi:MAG TPA: hypothetical protein VN933_11335 [Candidatus Eremiobacteraceae bacterium]|jgi:hypothetical protein|nr:hypothetical protein [Candidatus Eremiobacteraceae bacterium]
MKESTKRAIVRWLHIILAVPIIGYIYSPFDLVHYYAAPTRYVFVPTIVLSGLWLWKGHVVRRWFSLRPARDQRVMS